jgi:ribonuclease HI
LAWAKKEKLDYPIYSDSKTAIAWIRRKQVNTKLEWTSKNAKLHAAVLKAVDWIRTNEYRNPILKWETKLWGEIPADYGRK